MRKQAAILSSEGVSAVDDVSSLDVLDTARELGEPDLQNFEVRDLGDGHIEINSYVFQENWDEIDPPGCEDEPEFSHETVVAHIRNLVKELESEKC